LTQRAGREWARALNLLVSLAFALLGGLFLAAHPDWLAAGIVLALLAGAVLDALLARISRPGLSAQQLPGFRVAWYFGHPPFAPGRLLALLGLMAAMCGLPEWVFYTCGLLGLAYGLVAAAMLVAERRTGRTAGRVVAALGEYQPRCYLYYSDTLAGGYQLAMWLPYFERAGLRYALLLRDASFAAQARQLTGAPIVLARWMKSVEQALVPSVGAVFYVNNEARNAECVRFPRVTHVHLGHGDSDKSASFQPFTAMFDQIFVAGQAAIDRYGEHGVEIPRAKFTIVSRPQLERLSTEPGPRPPVVLYAPTWQGGLDDMRLSSLPFGEELVRALLELGARVVFRPHPYSLRGGEPLAQVRRVDALLRGRGETSADTREADLFELMNRSSALVADVSSLASDYLYTGKPLAIVKTGPENPPIMETAYVLEPGHLRAPLELLLGDDPLRETRLAKRGYFLGDIDEADPAAPFIAALRAATEGKAANMGRTG
jgi:hypothetical protein